MLKKIKNILGEKDFNGLKKPFFLSFIDAIFNSFNYSIMFLLLIKIINSEFTYKDLKIYMVVLIIVNIIRYFIVKKTSLMLQIAVSEAMANLRIKIGDYIRNLNMGYFNQNSIGVLINTATNDLNDLEMCVTSVGTEMLKNVIVATYLSIIILIFNPVLGGLLIALLLLEIPFIIKCGSVLKKTVFNLKSAKAGMLSRVIEYTSGIEVFKSYNLTGSKFNRLKNVLNDVKNRSIKVELSSLPYIIPITLIASISFVITLYFSANVFLSGKLEAKQLIIFTVLSLGLTTIVKVIGGQFVEFKTLTLSIEKLDTLFKTPQVPYEYDKYDFDNYNIEFSDVTFEYIKDKTVLENVSFKANEGEVIALVGASGSGKSTVLNLIARFWDVNQGEIKIGGTNINKVYPDELLKNISMVFQDVQLLNDTVFENIIMGNKKITKKEVIEAAKIAHCHDFVMEMEEGYDTIIKEGGKSLSGGEKQRISIARALIKDAPIVLLDEATASLDADNEYEIQKSIKSIVKDKTVIVIAHRLNTIKDADKILVFDDKKVIEQGSHDELMKLKGVYSKMYVSMSESKNWTIR